jgi:hypothetical protein
MRLTKSWSAFSSLSSHRLSLGLAVAVTTSFSLLDILVYVHGFQPTQSIDHHDELKGQVFYRHFSVSNLRLISFQTSHLTTCCIFCRLYIEDRHFQPQILRFGLNSLFRLPDKNPNIRHRTSLARDEKLIKPRTSTTTFTPFTVAFLGVFGSSA